MKVRTRILTTLTIAAGCLPLLLAGQTAPPAAAAGPALASITWPGTPGGGRFADPSAAFVPLLPPAANGGGGSYTPTYELFVGYSNFRALSQGASGNRIAWLSGASTSLAINANRYFGVVFDLGGYSDTRFGPNAPPTGGVVPATGNLYTIMVGPRFSWRHDRWTPFVQVLFGQAEASGVALTGCSGVGCFPLPRESSYALNAGGGLDLTLTRHFALRLFQAEYAMTRFRDPDTTADAVGYQKDARLSTGIVFRFGGERQPASDTSYLPPTNACTASPDSIVAGSGDQVTVSAQASDPNNFPLTYSWTSTGGTISGSGAAVQWNAAGLAPGSYTVAGQVDNRHGGTANCAAAIAVTAPPARPLALRCSAEPSAFAAGASTQITAVGTSPDGNSLTYTWQAAQGQITGTGATVGFDSTGLAAGSYNVSGHVADGQGGAADCSVALEVQAAAEAPPPVAALEVELSLHSIYFPTNQPDEQHPNDGLLASQKTILRTLAVNFKEYLQAKPDARITLEGHADDRASEAYNEALAERRVALSKSFLVAEGVPEANIDTHSFGKHQELDADQVKAQMEEDPNLSDEQRQALAANLPSIILAQNRRVDIMLNSSGRESVRRYPFNAKDALTLLNDNALQQH